MYFVIMIKVFEKYGGQFLNKHWIFCNTPPFQIVQTLTFSAYRKNILHKSKCFS